MVFEVKISVCRWTISLYIYISSGVAVTRDFFSTKEGTPKVSELALI
jgi:hypothetical protein